MGARRPLRSSFPDRFKGAKSVVDSVEQFILSGRIVDVALVVLVLEVLWLSWRYRRTGRGLPPRLLFTNAGAGGSLMLALKAALTGAGWPWIAAALLASLGFHVADLNHRWTRASEASTPPSSQSPQEKSEDP